MTDNLKQQIAEAIAEQVYTIHALSKPVEFENIVNKAVQAVLDIVGPIIACHKQDYSRLLKEYDDHLNSEPMMPKWHDIKDAPKDGIDCGYDGVHTRRILAWDKSWSVTNDPVVAYWDDGHWQVEGRDDATTHFKPTHWQPL